MHTHIQEEYMNTYCIMKQLQQEPTITEIQNTHAKHHWTKGHTHTQKYIHTHTQTHTHTHT